MITIRSNAADVAKRLGHAADQIPFAMALALTRTAKLAQADVIEKLPDSFEIRTPWIAKGIRVKPARKSDLAAGAEVWTKDRFLALHLEGGDRVPFSPGKDAVPSEGARPRKRDLTRKRVYPGMLLKPAGRGYLVNIGNGSIGVFRRKGKGEKSKTTLFWVLSKRIDVKADWPFAAQIDATVGRELPEQIVVGIADALRTRRP
jgi:hypothetical protein